MFDDEMSCQLQRCLIVLKCDGAFPVSDLDVDDVHWLRDFYGDQLVSRSGFVFLKEV